MEKSPAAAAVPVTLFVRNDAGTTRTVHIELRASVAELEEAVRRKVPGTEEMRLCAVGGVHRCEFTSQLCAAGVLIVCFEARRSIR